MEVIEMKNIPQILKAIKWRLWDICYLAWPGHWALLHAVVCQFKYDFGVSIASRRGWAMMKRIAHNPILEHEYELWVLDTSLQLNPYYVKEL